MTIYLNTGQFMRLTAGHTDCERRYFVSTNYWPFVPQLDTDSTALWEADPSQRVYDPDVFVDDGTWVEFTDYIHDDATTFQELSDGEVTKWVLTVEGHNFDSRYIQADHPLLVFYRLWPDVEQVDWSEWHLLCIGYFKADGIAQDYLDAKLWQATVEGVSQFFAKRLIPPQTFTRTDITLNQPVTTSDLLQDMRLEANKGEFLGLPTNSGQNLVDGDDAVPCIWNNEPTPAPEPLVFQKQDGQLRINELFLTPTVGIGNGYQMVEIFNTAPYEPVDLQNIRAEVYDSAEALRGTIDLKYVFPLAQGEDWTPSGSALAEDMTATAFSNIAVTNPANLGMGLQVRIEGEEMSMVSDKVSPAHFARPNMPKEGIFHPSGATIEKRGDTTRASSPSIPPHGFLIICENRRRLQEMFRIPDGTLVAEWADDGRNATLRLDEAGGHIRLLNEYGEIDRVYWGDGAIAEWTAESIQTVYVGGYTVWNGARVPVPARAHSIKRKIAGGGAGANGADSHNSEDWMEEDVPTPGRRQSAIGDDGKRIIADVAWAAVQLPTLTCELSQDLDDGDTELSVNNTNGFYADREKNVLIVTAIAAYDSKTANTITLSEAWAGGNVPAGTRLYPIDGQGVAHDYWPISTIEMVRKRQPTPSVYTVYTSTIASPLMPQDDETWKEEWTEVAHSSTSYISRLREDIDDGDTTIAVDNTAGWPLSGLTVIKTQDQTGQPKTLYAEYTSKTWATIHLKNDWSYGSVQVYPDSNPENITICTASIEQPLRAIHTLQTARRARHVLVIIDAMSDFGRGKLNAVRVYPDMAATTNPAVQIDGASVVNFAQHLCRVFGLPDVKFSTPRDESGKPLHDVTLLSLSTAEDTALSLLSDLARKTGMHVRFLRADGVRWRPSPEHPWGAITGDDEEIDFTFLPDHALTLQVQRGITATVGQAVVKYKLTGSNEVGATVYPSQPAAPANPYVHSDIVVVPDASVAYYLAEMYYRRLAAPVSLTLVLPSFPWDWLHPLARVIVNWNFDVHPNDPFRRYFYVVETMDCRIEGEDQERTPLTALTMRRLKPAP